MRETRVFGGKKYTFLYYRDTKEDAQAEAKKERKAGWKIRIVRQKIGKRVYYDLFGRR